MAIYNLPSETDVIRIQGNQIFSVPHFSMVFSVEPKRSE